MSKTEAHACAPEGSLTALRSILRELAPGAPLEESLSGLLKVLSKQMGYLRVFLAIMTTEAGLPPPSNSFQRSTCGTSRKSAETQSPTPSQ